MPKHRMRQSKSTKADLVFPVSRIHRYLKAQRATPKIRISVRASVYLAAVLEYLIAEIIEISGTAASDNAKKRIIPRHLLLAIRSDEELNYLLRDVIIPNGGIVPGIHSILLPKRTK